MKIRHVNITLARPSRIMAKASLLLVTFAVGSTPAAANEAAVGAETNQRPNIVFIVADDLGYGDLGCYGQEKIKTPRLDQMAREGIRFTSHYAGFTVCSPSRCALMTGKHMGHASVKGNGGRLRASDITVAMLLKQAGYKTCMIGKWGLVGRPGHPGSPNNKGFDHFLGLLANGMSTGRDRAARGYRRHQLSAGAAGADREQKKHEYFYWIWAIRVGKWKLHTRGKNRYALYDLENDIAEKHDLSDKLPEVVARSSTYFEVATRE